VSDGAPIAVACAQATETALNRGALYPTNTGASVVLRQSAADSDPAGVFEAWPGDCGRF
jgi:hypothetical protein